MPNKTPHPLIAVIPIVALIAMLAVVLTIFNSDAISGGSQVALIFASAVGITIAMAKYKVKWKDFEHQFQKTFGEISVTLVILLCVGMLAGSWMISGVVPTLIYYGIQILSPSFFLVSACVISAFVSLLSGSSWTTIATIGVALLGIGQALGVSEAWTAGAIISGAYFGDKMSPLSDTTILASSTVRVDLFTHIRYMMYTTFPSFGLTLVIFLVAGFCFDSAAEINVDHFVNGLEAKFNISLWTLLVPLLTGILIARRVPSLITLFASSVAAGVMALIFQPDILHEIAGQESKDVLSTIQGLMVMLFGQTHIDMGDSSLNDLVATRGMAGMLNTIWLIICAMLFGSVMIASRMVQSITKVIIRMAKSRTSLVGATASSGVFLNVVTGDQFLSIVLTADLFKHAYEKNGYEPRLLSRTAEDSATVASVLIPWNTCGMTQAAVLGVPTLVYLPFCFFNILSPLMSVIVAASGWKIKKNVQPE
ncbi:MAG: Na+/H+ antiporter NhaC family protein [Bacteroidaceae bacterium]